MKRLLPWLLLLGIVGCGDGLEQTPGDVVAWVDGRRVSASELELYLSVNLIDDAAAPDADAEPEGEDGDRVRSRLFDALLEERVLLVEASRRGVAVSDEEIDDYLTLLDSEQSGQTGLDESARRALARQRLMIQRLLDEEVGALEPVSDEDVHRFLEREPNAGGSGRRVIVRTLLFDSVDEANQVYQGIRKHRTSFAKTALDLETQPGQASPLTLSWDGLPENVRAVLESLTPGEVGRPVDYHGQVYLFQLHAWLDSEPEGEPARMAEARRRLERQRRREAVEAFRAELLESSQIKRETAHLPFRYVPAAEG